MAVASLFDPFTGKEQIDEKQKLMFLISPAYCNLLRKMVVGLTADHKLMVYLLPPESPDLAFTDGSHIMINTLHQLFIAQPVGDVTKYCLALAVHESLHPIYSCFECTEDAARKKAGDTDNVIQIRRELFNILEDARIERIGAFKFPGVAYAVEALNEFLFGLPKDFTQSKDIEIMMQWILDFVSVDKTRGELKDNLKKLWTKIEPLALKAKYSDTCSGCYFYTKKILKLLKPLIPETDPIEQQRQKAQNRQGNAKDVDAKTGQQPPQGGATGNGPSRGAQSNQPGNGQNANNGQSGQGQANSSGQGQGQGAGQGGADALSQMLANALTASFNEHQKDMAAAAQDKQTTKGISGDSSSEYSVVPCQGDFSTFDEYTRIKTDVAPVINKLRTGLKNIINYNVDEISRYLHAGRIDSKSLSRMPSGAICAKRIEKNDEADLNITVLVDLSGSMNGYPIENAMKACVVLQEVCNSMKIPITVLGFKSGRQKVQILHFSNRLLKGRYAHTGIVKMDAGGGTPLYNALLYLPRLLKKQSEEDKLLIVITDGAPDTGPEPCKIEVTKLGRYAKVYGMAIGGGRDALANIFGSKYIGIDSLDRLPGDLCKVIEKNIIRR
jgi:cobalamin biosynthesis protein CobT